jgi:flagellar biosynthesis protein FliR
VELALGGAPLAALLARPAAAILVLAWASGALPPLAALAVAATVALSLAFFQLPALTLEGAWALTQSAPQALAFELVRGVALGLGAAAPLWAAITAGGWAGQRWRLGGDASPVTALYAAMLGVAFVAVDGPVLVCAALARSYAAAPLGAPLLASGLDVMAVAGWLETAVRLCLPLLGAVAVAELAVAAATRAGAAVAVAWPSAVLAPALVLLVTAPLVPLLIGALAAAVRRGLS